MMMKLTLCCAVAMAAALAASGAAAEECEGVGTFSGVNPDAHDLNGKVIPVEYKGRTRRERHDELIAYAISGGITQARIAHEMSGGKGRILEGPQSWHGDLMPNRINALGLGDKYVVKFAGSADAIWATTETSVSPVMLPVMASVLIFAT